MRHIAIFASGSGTNAENIARYFNGGDKAQVTLLISNRRGAGVIRRMDNMGVETMVVPNSVWDSDPEQIVGILRDHRIDLVVLAGFMHYVASEIVDAYNGRILNIHPSLLPAYGGKGMYGHHVHEAVVANRESESGVTVHYVTGKMDEGEILLQKKVSVLPTDTPATLEEKIHPVEYEIYPLAIEKALGRLDPPPVEKAEAQWAERLKIKNYHPRTAPDGPDPSDKDVPGEEALKLYKPNVPDAPRILFDGKPMPPAYFLPAILSTVFCCLPAGIIAIIFSSKVSGRYYAGNYEGALKASRMARIWTIVSFSVGITIGSVIGLFNFVLAL